MRANGVRALLVDYDAEDRDFDVLAFSLNQQAGAKDPWALGRDDLQLYQQAVTRRLEEVRIPNDQAGRLPKEVRQRQPSGFPFSRPYPAKKQPGGSR